jgi:hypothetical protein
MNPATWESTLPTVWKRTLSTIWEKGTNFNIGKDTPYNVSPASLRLSARASDSAAGAARWLPPAKHFRRPSTAAAFA